MKLIALDLDGTTFNSNKEISRENIKAIKKAQAQGHIVMVLSGRALHEIKPDLERYDLDCHVGANNGSSLYVQDELVDIITLQPEQINHITSQLDKEFIPYTMSTNKGVFVPKDWDQRLEKVLSVAEAVPTELELFSAFAESYGHQHFNHINDIVNDESYTIQKFFGITLDPIQKKRFEAFLDSMDEISVASTTYFLDIMHHKASKGNALKTMANHFNIPLENTVAIGDESNDISMFQIAGLAVAMGNASDEIKKFSDVVTLSNDEHGVAYAINKYVLGG